MATNSDTTTTRQVVQTGAGLTYAAFALRDILHHNEGVGFLAESEQRDIERLAAEVERVRDAWYAEYR